MNTLKPGPMAQGIAAYTVPKTTAPIRYKLDANEGRPPGREFLEGIRLGDEKAGVDRYPSRARLTRQIAEELGIEIEQVLVTAGGDDALQRSCMAVLGPGRELILPVPTFEMIGRYARFCGADVRSVAWNDGAFPLDAVRAQLSERTAAIAVVSPNNPTGGVITAGQLSELSAAAPQALLIVDLAYCEFADENLLPTVLSLPNAVAICTFSKAWGLAGLRVGYAVGPSELIGWLGSVGNPYPTSVWSLKVAEESLRRRKAEVEEYCQQVRSERARLEQAARQWGLQATESQGNFVLLRFSSAELCKFAWQALGSLGFAVRLFPPTAQSESAQLTTALRITCPGDEAVFVELQRALESAISPQAILFDMDGVLADVRESYRQAIIETARVFGVALELADISAAKALGNANNDWILTQRLLEERGVILGLEEVTTVFEKIYQGTSKAPGVRRHESLLCKVEELAQLRESVRLAVVTGRPRADALRFLHDCGIESLFETLVCMEDAPAKPDPAPVRLALATLGIERAWLIGDTVDDVRAARAAGVVPFGVVSTADSSEKAEQELLGSGAARIVAGVAELCNLLTLENR